MDKDYTILATAQNINFVNSFTNDLHNLMNVIGVTHVQTMAPGSAFRVYKSSGTVKTAAVAAGEEVPDSKITMSGGDLVEVTYTKVRNVTPIEEIGKKGYEVAVGGTNEQILGAMIANIRKSVFDAIATGTGTAEAADFQSKVAAAASFIAKKFEDVAYTPVVFASPDDAFGYLGTHTITVENASGLNYLKNFMGLGNVIIDSNVPAGTVYGTAAENLNLVAADVSGIPGFEVTTDQSGLIAVHNGAKYSHAGIETVAFSGLKFLPSALDRIVAVTTVA